MAVRLTVVGSSPAWPNPGGAQSGYLVEDGGGRLLLDCGPGVARPAARARRRLAAHRRGRDHALAPRPLGRSRALGVGQPQGPGHGTRERAELWLPPEGRERIRDFGSRLGWDDMFDQTFDIRDYAGDEPFRAAGFTVLARRLPHYTLLTFGLRVTNGSRSLAYSGDTGPDAALAELAHDVDLLDLRGDARARRARRHAARAPVRRRGAGRVPTRRARDGS